MALVTSSQVVLDLDATPIVKSNRKEKGGAIRYAAGHITAANFVGATAGQWYTFVRIPVRAVVADIKLAGATTTSGAVKCGLYRPNGIAISDAIFTDNLNMAVEKDGLSILVVPTALERTQDIATAYATQIGTAGATGDVEVDIALAIVTALGGSIAHSMIVEYVMPE